MPAINSEDLFYNRDDLMRAFDEWFKVFTTWGLSRDELLECSFTPGDNSGDTVFTSESGSQMTRYMCNRWLDFYSAASAGWSAAIAAPVQDEILPCLRECVAVLESNSDLMVEGSSAWCAVRSAKNAMALTAATQKGEE